MQPIKMFDLLNVNTISALLFYIVHYMREELITTAKRRTQLLSVIAVAIDSDFRSLINDFIDRGDRDGTSFRSGFREPLPLPRKMVRILVIRKNTNF